MYSDKKKKNKFKIVYCVDLTNYLYFQGALHPKEAASAHMGTSQTPAYCPFEYTFGQYPYDRYG